MNNYYKDLNKEWPVFMQILPKALLLNLVAFVYILVTLFEIVFLSGGASTGSAEAIGLNLQRAIKVREKKEKPESVQIILDPLLLVIYFFEEWPDLTEITLDLHHLVSNFLDE